MKNSLKMSGLGVFSVVAAVATTPIASGADFAGFGPRMEIGAPASGSGPTWSGGNWLGAADLDGDGHMDVVVRGNS